MSGSGRSRANENRAIRQEALREQFSNKGLYQHVLEISNKLNNLEVDIDPLQVQRLRHAADINMKLVDKYLPTEKPTQITGANNGPVEFQQLSDEELKKRAESLAAAIGLSRISD